MKLSVNLSPITMVTGLCEASHFATEHGLDMEAHAARDAHLASPLVDVCHTLYTQTANMGLGQNDMAVVQAIEERTRALWDMSSNSAE